MLLLECGHAKALYYAKLFLHCLYSPVLTIASPTACKAVIWIPWNSVPCQSRCPTNNAPMQYLLVRGGECHYACSAQAEKTLQSVAARLLDRIPDETD